MLHAFCASYVSAPVLQTAKTAYYPQPQPQAKQYDYYGQSYQYYEQQPVYAPAQLMYQGYESHREEPPPPPLGIPPAREVDEGGEISLSLKKEEDEAEPSVGAPEPEPKLEEKVVQEAVQEALPEAKPEDKQQPADTRQPPPARGEPLLTQKGPEANAATGGVTGAGVFRPMRYRRSACPALIWLWDKRRSTCSARRLYVCPQGHPARPACFPCPAEWASEVPYEDDEEWDADAVLGR